VDTTARIGRDGAEQVCRGGHTKLPGPTKGTYYTLLRPLKSHANRRWAGHRARVRDRRAGSHRGGVLRDQQRRPSEKLTVQRGPRLDDWSQIDGAALHRPRPSRRATAGAHVERTIRTRRRNFRTLKYRPTCPTSSLAAACSASRARGSSTGTMASTTTNPAPPPRAEFTQSKCLRSVPLPIIAARQSVSTMRHLRHPESFVRGGPTKKRRLPPRGSTRPL